MKKQWQRPEINQLSVNMTYGGGGWGGSEETQLSGVKGNPMSWYGAPDFETYWEKTLVNYGGTLNFEEANRLYTSDS